MTRLTHTCLIPVLFIVLALVGVGCGAPDECDDEGTRCVGNTAESCLAVADSEFSSYLSLHREDCGSRVCRLPPAGATGRAFCSLGETPDPLCPPELRAGDPASRCVEGGVVTWRFGFRVSEVVCGTGAACADATTPGFDPTCKATAFCSPLAEAEPLCGPGIGTFCADDTTIVHCSCGFQRDAHACESPGPGCTMISVGGGAPPQGACR